MTFDDAIAMLKKEGIDPNDVWAAFLEERGLTVELFSQLVDEAAALDDPEEMDALLAVEGMFQQYVLGQLMESEQSEGFLDRIKRAVGLGPKEDPAAKQAEMQKKWQAAKDVRSKFGVKATKAASSVGTQVGTPLAQKKVAAVQARKKPMMNASADEDTMTFECDDDGAGNPMMPWAKIRSKYR
jgi:hypothetical protein